MNSPAKLERPLSPYLNYRWQYTMALSFLHRVTGCAMTVGLLLLVYWVAAVAAGADAYARAQEVFAHPLIHLALIVFSFSFFYHLANGVRHLFWDAGYGFEKKTARASGWFTFIAALVVTALFWILTCSRLSGGAV